MPNVYLCNAEDVKGEQPLRVELKGLKAIALYRLGEDYCATSDECSHMEASLGEFGYIEGDIVECTLHGCKFDIRTGEPQDFLCLEALKIYPVKLVNGKLYIADAEG